MNANQPASELIRRLAQRNNAVLVLHERERKDSTVSMDFTLRQGARDSIIRVVRQKNEPLCHSDVFPNGNGDNHDYYGWWTKPETRKQGYFEMRDCNARSARTLRKSFINSCSSSVRSIRTSWRNTIASTIWSTATMSMSIRSQPKLIHWLAIGN